MAEESIYIHSGNIKLEGLLEKLPGESAVVVTHPHPLYGGEMHNNVVEALVQTYRDKGYSTLRFNFRGAGRSEGNHDEGKGEQEDIKSALNYLSDLGKTDIDLAGYSFGAWVIALGLGAYDQANRVIFVSPPVNFIDFSFLTYNPKIRLIIVGSHDDIAGPGVIEGMVPKWNPGADFKIIQGADHFYWGHTNQLKAIIQELLG
ncbi:MAG: alpha/beta hydrolase [Pseudomonadota bacterium]